MKKRRREKRLPKMKSLVKELSTELRSLPREEEPEYPSYSAVGRILVSVGPYDGPRNLYKHYYEVLDCPQDTCVFWIEEGMGTDYWFDLYCDFPKDGIYVVEGITGTYIRGDWSWGEDDDEDWEFTSIREATSEEIKTETLGEINETRT